jgi:serine/threonine protein phosphatase 1
MVYIIGDVHGCYDTLMALVAKLPKDAKLIFLGDLIDRGPKSRQVIEFVRNGGYDCVQGNHEQLMIDEIEVAINGFSNNWTPNGGDTCLESYKGFEDQLYDDIEWAKELPRLIVNSDYKDKMGRTLVLSHAPVLDFMEYYFDIRKKIENGAFTEHELIDFEHTVSNGEELMIWNRNIPKKEQTQYFNVCGHNPIDSFVFDRYNDYKTSDIDKCITPDKIVIDTLRGYANIDTGACYKDCGMYRGVLTALEFPSMKVIQQENIDAY